MTRDPAMLLWLNGGENTKDAPNENYGREMMELFTLGADRGYTEDDVREQARALTGWPQRLDDEHRRRTNFRFDPQRHDTGVEDDLRARRGNFDWRDSCRLCVDAPDPPVLLRPEAVELLRPGAARRAPRSAALEQLYAARATRCRPVVEAILRHPALYDGPRDGEAAGRLHSPGCCARSAAGSTRRLGLARRRWPGQQLFYPPNVAGWDDTRWLDTATLRGRWYDRRSTSLDATTRSTPSKPHGSADDAEKLLDARSARSGTTPPLDERRRAALLDVRAARARRRAGADWKQQQYPAMVARTRCGS